MGVGGAQLHLAAVLAVGAFNHPQLGGIAGSTSGKITGYDTAKTGVLWLEGDILSGAEKHLVIIVPCSRHIGNNEFFTHDWKSNGSG